MERVVLVAFGVALAAGVVRLAGWGPDWWAGVQQGSGVAFVLVLLVYLGVGGTERVSEYAIGSVGLALFALAFLAQVADAWFGFGAPVWEVVRNVVLAGFLVCFAAYVGVRWRAP
jgi:hypothetical protein